MVVATTMAGQDVPPPRWHESYTDSTVLVALVHTPLNVSSKDPEAQLFWYHNMASRLDAALLPVSEAIWKVQSYTMPYYCLVCPNVNHSSHADQVVSLAVDLRAAAQQLTEMDQTVPDISIGIYSGESAVGLIGQDGLSFYMTGSVVELAKALADEGHPLAVHESTWTRMGDLCRSSYSWKQTRCSQGSSQVYVALLPSACPQLEGDGMPCQLDGLHSLAENVLGEGARAASAARQQTRSSAAPGGLRDPAGDAPRQDVVTSSQQGPSTTRDAVFVDDLDSAWFHKRWKELQSPGGNKGAPEEAVVAEPNNDVAAAAPVDTRGQRPSTAAAESKGSSSGVMSELSALLRDRWHR